MRQRYQFLFVLAICSAMTSAGSSAAPQTVKLKHDTEKEQITVTIGDEVFTVFHLGGKWPKPFASPVHGPGEVVMTREISRPGVKIDHPHHKGIWVAVDEVNENKHWAEQAKIQNVRSTASGKGNPAQISLTNNWLGADGEDGEPVVEETTTISIFPNRLMVYDITFKALDKPVTFNDTKEGLFGFRMVESMRESNTGKVVNSDGLKGTKEAWGKTADWVDYSGQIDGKTFGVTLMDHPGNFRRSRYHVRNYGLFSISPFGEQAYAKLGAKPVTIKPGKSLRLRYGLYIHAGGTKAAKVADVYQDFVKFAKK